MSARRVGRTSSPDGQRSCSLALPFWRWTGWTKATIADAVIKSWTNYM